MVLFVYDIGRSYIFINKAILGLLPTRDFYMLSLPNGHRSVGALLLEAMSLDSQLVIIILRNHKILKKTTSHDRRSPDFACFLRRLRGPGFDSSLLPFAACRHYPIRTNKTQHNKRKGPLMQSFTHTSEQYKWSEFFSNPPPVNSFPLFTIFINLA